MAEAVPPNMAVSDITCDPSPACSGPSLPVGVVTAAVTGGALTTVNFTNRSTIATLHLCKVGIDILSATPFEFSIAGETVGVTTVVETGSCEQIDILEGTYIVSEIVPDWAVVDAIDCAPAAACSNVSLAVGSVTASLAGATATTITFTNRLNSAAALALQRVGSSAAEVLIDSR